jgi:hypothetical protein
MKENVSKNFIIGTFVTLYIMVSIISTIHVIDFFELSNPRWLAITLAIAFEVGAAASLASIIALKKMNKSIVWALFFLLTAMQAMGNTYYAYKNLVDFRMWSELFGLIDYEPIFQKRIMSIVSGAILPLVALGFIKSLVDYIRPDSSDINTESIEPTVAESTPTEEPTGSNGPDDSNLNEVNHDDDNEDDLFTDLESELEYWDTTLQDSLDEGEKLPENALGLYAYDDFSDNNLYNNLIDYQNGEPNVEKVDFDEDHALDMLLNNMVKDMSEDEISLDAINNQITDSVTLDSNLINESPEPLKSEANEVAVDTIEANDQKNEEIPNNKDGENIMVFKKDDNQ